MSPEVHVLILTHSGKAKNFVVSWLHAEVELQNRRRRRGWRRGRAAMMGCYLQRRFKSINVPAADVEKHGLSAVSDRDPLQEMRGSAAAGLVRAQAACMVVISNAGNCLSR